MKGYYSMGLAGYEVEILDDERVQYTYIAPTETVYKPQKSKIYYTKNGRAYFLANGRRVHLDECLRANFPN